MKKSRLTEQQIVGVLKEAEAGAKTADLCRKHGISPATRYDVVVARGAYELLVPSQSAPKDPDAKVMLPPSSVGDKGTNSRHYCWIAFIGLGVYLAAAEFVPGSRPFSARVGRNGDRHALESQANRRVVFPAGSVFDVAVEHRRALPATMALNHPIGFFARAAAVAKPRRRLWPATSDGSIPTARQRRFTTCATIRSQGPSDVGRLAGVRPQNSGPSRMPAAASHPRTARTGQVVGSLPYATAIVSRRPS